MKFTFSGKLNITQNNENGHNTVRDLYIDMVLDLNLIKPKANNCHINKHLYDQLKIASNKKLNEKINQ